MHVINRVKGMPWPKTGVTHYHAQLGLSDKGRAIKGHCRYSPCNKGIKGIKNK